MHRTESLSKRIDFCEKAVAANPFIRAGWTHDAAALFRKVKREIIPVQS